MSFRKNNMQMNSAQQTNDTVVINKLMNIIHYTRSRNTSKAKYTSYAESHQNLLLLR
jgi:hypothetical protein